MLNNICSCRQDWIVCCGFISTQYLVQAFIKLMRLSSRMLPVTAITLCFAFWAKGYIQWSTILINQSALVSTYQKTTTTSFNIYLSMITKVQNWCWQCPSFTPNSCMCALYKRVVLFVFYIKQEYSVEYIIHIGREILKTSGNIVEEGHKPVSHNLVCKS